MRTPVRTSDPLLKQPHDFSLVLLVQAIERGQVESAS